MRRLPILSTLVFVLAAAVAAFAQAPQTPAANEAETAMLKDAQRIAKACQQYMNELASEKVSFDVNPATGKVTGLLASFLQDITPGTKVVDGLLSNPDDTFSLQNPKAFGGAVIVFDADGKRVKK